MRIKNKMNYWWVWSPKGPAIDGIHYGRQFTNGMLPFPVPGDVATELEANGLWIKEWQPGEEFDHWDKDGHRYMPVFCKPDREAFPQLPDDLPDSIPDEWAQFIGKYTSTGRLKKAYRGD